MPMQPYRPMCHVTLQCATRQSAKSSNSWLKPSPHVLLLPCDLTNRIRSNEFHVVFPTSVSHCPALTLCLLRTIVLHYIYPRVSSTSLSNVNTNLSPSMSAVPRQPAFDNRKRRRCSHLRFGNGCIHYSFHKCYAQCHERH